MYIYSRWWLPFGKDIWIDDDYPTWSYYFAPWDSYWIVPGTHYWTKE